MRNWLFPSNKPQQLLGCSHSNDRPKSVSNQLFNRSFFLKRLCASVAWYCIYFQYMLILTFITLMLCMSYFKKYYCLVSTPPPDYKFTVLITRATTRLVWDGIKCPCNCIYRYIRSINTCELVHVHKTNIMVYIFIAVAAVPWYNICIDFQID